MKKSSTLSKKPVTPNIGKSEWTNKHSKKKRLSNSFVQKQYVSIKVHFAYVFDTYASNRQQMIQKYIQIARHSIRLEMDFNPKMVTNFVKQFVCVWIDRHLFSFFESIPMTLHMAMYVYIVFDIWWIRIPKRKKEQDNKLSILKTLNKIFPSSW